MIPVEWNAIESIPKDGTIIKVKTYYGIIIASYNVELNIWDCYDDLLPIDDTNNIEGWLPYNIGDLKCL